MLSLAFHLRTGVRQSKFCHLSVMFDSYRAFAPAHEYAEPEINVGIPEFKNTEARKADAWLKAYAKRLDKWLGDRSAPRPKEQV